MNFYNSNSEIKFLMHYMLDIASPRKMSDIIFCDNIYEGTLVSIYINLNHNILYP